MIVGKTHAQWGWTALIGAAIECHVNCARLLLDAGADKDAKDNVRVPSAASVDGRQCSGFWNTHGVCLHMQCACNVLQCFENCGGEDEYCLILSSIE